MTPRQSPRQWMIVDAPLDPATERAIRRAPRGSGILLLAHNLPPRQRRELVRRLRQLAQARGLALVDEAAPRAAARVHDLRELRTALLRDTRLILLSPLFATPSHPDWRPIPRMRAAALARLANRRLIALGGMNLARFQRIKPLGFVGWAGISAWARALMS
ncbi:thiamine phosphate synthase [Sphingomonas lutea]|uniref:Thiamine phosphate synthase n=1 Tax=Sphingomonas lutea TaxID=1045317 RepID=A0A7G9SIG8_9SPHN|nr:thiamine phosphate synthase [Sphingomonas lutea]QNN67643.1 thiamine phosphate synthase [Sphingomonas lutea]